MAGEATPLGDSGADIASRRHAFDALLSHSCSRKLPDQFPCVSEVVSEGGCVGGGGQNSSHLFGPGTTVLARFLGFFWDRSDRIDRWKEPKDQ